MEILSEPESNERVHHAFQSSRTAASSSNAVYDKPFCEGITPL